MNNFLKVSLFLILFAGIFIPAGFADIFDDFAKPQTSVRKYPEKNVSADRKVTAPKSAEELFKAYFRFAAKDDFEGMYLLMSPDYRAKNNFGKFEYFMEDDLKVSGGLKGFSGLKKVRDNGRFASWQITLEYNNARMANRTVIVEVMNRSGAYYFNNGMLMPLAAINK